MTYRSIPGYLCILIPSILTLLATQVCFGQFRTDPYYPVLGRADEIDSIYGFRDEQMLGSNLQVLGYSYRAEKTLFTLAEHVLDTPRGRIELSLFGYDSTFDLHNLTFIQDVSFLYPGTIVPVHLRGGGTIDLLVDGPLPTTRIYWSDVNGKYDSSWYTDLMLPWQGDQANKYSNIDPIVIPKSDGTSTIVLGVLVYRSDPIQDSVYFMRFEGLDFTNLRPRRAYPTEVAFWRESDSEFSHEGNNVVGDFNGDSYPDVIYFYKELSNDAFYYRGSPSLNLSEFGQALLSDTLLLPHDHSVRFFTGNSKRKPGLVVKTDHRSPPDDLLVMGVLDDTLLTRRMLLFRGSEQFGTTKLTTADLVINAPEMPHLGYVAWGLDFWNGGDMSGTGHDVIGVHSYFDFRAGGLFFYNLEPVRDDSVDAFYTVIPNGGMSLYRDTHDANQDGKTDQLLGFPWYHTYDDAMNHGKTEVGTIHLLYGTSRILDGQSSVKGWKGNQPVSLCIWPSPATDFVNVDLKTEEQGFANVKINNLAGVLLQSLEVPINLGRLTIPLDEVGAKVVLLRIQSSLSRQVSFVLPIIK